MWNWYFGPKPGKKMLMWVFVAIPNSYQMDGPLERKNSLRPRTKHVRSLENRSGCPCNPSATVDLGLWSSLTDTELICSLIKAVTVSLLKRILSPMVTGQFLATDAYRKQFTFFSKIAKVSTLIWIISEFNCSHWYLTFLDFYY